MKSVQETARPHAAHTPWTACPSTRRNERQEGVSANAGPSDGRPARHRGGDGRTYGGCESRAQRVSVAVVDRFDARTAAGEEPVPGRRLDRMPLDEPPYYVIEAVPAITFPFHGVRIDDRAPVLGKDGAPVEGLLAAGSDTGGLWHRAHAVGIASALAFGLTAAGTAAVRAAPQDAPVPGRVTSTGETR
ncbi:FAD-binding protein [Streptomyces sp. NPDC002838]|uniref:FAD-binding protein n=1 Tax=Streptomyces sp. NPDC002838 TaxID=3154436 RepID=UPI00333287AB